MTSAKAASNIVKEILAEANRAETESLAATSSASAAVMSVRMVAGMMGEMMRGLGEVGTRVAESEQCVSRVDAELKKTLERAAVLARAVEEIASTAQLIDSIARQTNMLALNAMIEAAHAGDRGKGFAVVADEVKALSRQTAQATEGVYERLATIRQANEEVTASVGTLNQDVSGIRKHVEAVASAVGEQNSSLGTVSNCAKEAADSMEGIAGTLERIATFARDAGEKVRQLEQASTI